MATSVNPKKKALAKCLAKAGFCSLLLTWVRLKLRGAYIRVVNYHGTPAESRTQFEKQLQWYLKVFTPAGSAELETILTGNPWPHSKPGLLITFDDGLRNNYEVAAPLLEKYGFRGWFMLPEQFISCPISEQRQFARDHSIRESPGEEGERIAMNWDEVENLAQRHEIACHTANHVRLSEDLTPDELGREIRTPRYCLEHRLNEEVTAFCWVGGEETSYSSSAAQMIREAGYRWSFMTNNEPVTVRTNPLQIQRTNIESDWPLNVVKFQICGIMDIIYAGKRRRVNRLTEGSNPVTEVPH